MRGKGLYAIKLCSGAIVLNPSKLTEIKAKKNLNYFNVSKLYLIWYKIYIHTMQTDIIQFKAI